MRMLIGLLILLLSSPVYAQFTGSGLSLSGGGRSEGGSDACIGGTTHFAGDTTDYGDANFGNMTADLLGCVLYTANCGDRPFTTAHFHKHDAGADNAKMCVYTAQHAAEHSPDSGDTKIGCTNGESVSGLNWVALTGNIGGSATNGGSYWVCIVTNSALMEVIRTASGTRTFYYNSYLSGYSSPPENLGGGGGWTAVGSRDFSMYVEID